ncbi:proline--tRNA ligase, partial [Xylella fastidiosa subsp. multiplex]|nr:proline--tRNA ligase [Xylella fastidiosa subsp. multiplex]
VCVINPKKNPVIIAAAELVLAELQSADVDTVLDDRGLRPGVMFADMELIGIPHRIVVSERGLAAGELDRHCSEDDGISAILAYWNFQ